MNQHHAIRVRYWGAVGSLARPLTADELERKVIGSLQALRRSGHWNELADADDATLRELLAQHVPFECRSSYGGNTTCLEIETADCLVIIDAGTGLRNFGSDLQRRWDAGGEVRDIQLLLSHTHLDHIAGFPFFDPLYEPENRITIRGTAEVLETLQDWMGRDEALRGRVFPPTLPMMRGVVGFQPIPDGGSWTVGNTRITTAALTHPGGSLGFGIEYGNRRVVVASDHEPRRDPDDQLIEFAQDADFLYADAQYRNAEYEGRDGIAGQPPLSREGWGHGTVEDLVDLAVRSDVKQLHLGHHEPLRDDAALAELERYALTCLAQHSNTHCQVAFAREGQEVKV